MDVHEPESLEQNDPPLRVIVADDDPLARRALRDVLQAAGITVIAEACGGREVIELSIYYRPDVVVMDLIMPGIDGLTATQRILERVPEARIVILTASEDDELGLVTLRAGACGFRRKSIGIEALPRALERAREGEAIVTRRLTNRLIEELRHVSRDTTGMRPIRSRLTSREWEVLDMLSQGMSTDEMAGAMVVSIETVRSHVKSVLRKLGVRSRREAVEAASRLRSAVPEDCSP
jgi:DNA-binding NarL/FixJ family response regulator